MKFYEKNFGQGLYLFPLLPGIIRLDGRSFHKFTQNLSRPYELGLSQLMIKTSKKLVEETGALIGYTQSDEISLLLYSDNFDTQLYFDGRTQKIVSQSAAFCTQFFNEHLPDYLPNKVGKKPLFDSRVFNLPNKAEVVAYFKWRVRDAVKNSITMAASSVYSHNELHLKNSKTKQEMLYQKGINWNDYPMFFKEGTFVSRVKKVKSYSPEELNRLPAKHAARSNPDLLVERTEIKQMDIPKFESITNLVDVLFHGQQPIVN